MGSQIYNPPPAVNVEQIAGFVNIPDYGAVIGSDASTAINTAIKEAARLGISRVRVPQGEWTSEAQVLCEKANITLEGDSELGTIINFTSALGAKAAVRSTGAGTAFKVEKMTVKTTGTATVGVGFNTVNGETNQLKVEGPVKGVVGEGTNKIVCRFTNPTLCTENGIVLNGSLSQAIWCTANKNGSGSITNEGGIVAKTGTGIKVAHCTTEENATHGIYGIEAPEVEVLHCRAVENGKKASEESRNGRGISIGKETTGAKIVGNTCKGNWETGIFHGEAAVGITNATITNNYCISNNKGEKAGGHGIEYDGIGGTVSNNECIGNNNGISLNGSNVTVLSNTCVEGKKGGAANKGHGIQFNNAARMTIVGNVCHNNEGRGIYGSASEAQGGAVVVGNNSYSNTEANVEVVANYTSAMVSNNVEETGFVKAAQLASEAVEESKIKAGAVTATKLGSEAVETAKIKTGAIEEGQLKAEAVSEGKLKSTVKNKLLTLEAATALTSRAEKTEFEPGSSKAAIVNLQLEGATLTRTKIAVKVGEVIVSEVAISATSAGVTVENVTFAVPAAGKWQWEKVEGTPTVKTSYTIL